MNDKMTPRELAKRIARGEKWKLAEADQELAGLPEDVREAIVYCDGIFDDADNGEWATIRAELLRLARENAELQDANSLLGSANETDFHVRRSAEAALAESRAALDHIARVALGSRTKTKRTNWIAERAKSALNGDNAWKDVAVPKGYHCALERGALLPVGDE